MIKKYELGGTYTDIDGSFLWDGDTCVQESLYCLLQGYGQQFYGLRIEIWGKRVPDSNLPLYIIDVMDVDHTESLAINSTLAMLQFLSTYLPTIKLAADMQVRLQP